MKGSMANGSPPNCGTPAECNVFTVRMFNFIASRARLLHDFGFSCQKPERRALERDEARIEQWKRKDWPRVKKRCAAGCPHRLRRRIRLHADPHRSADLGAGGSDPGHSLPLQPCPNLGDRRSVDSPKRHRLGFYFRLHAKNIARDEVEDFLWYLLKHLRGHVFVIWDGASIHHAKGLSDFCSKYPRLHLEKLPAYAPELNPIEAAWHAAKHPLANGRPDNIPELGCALLASLRKARASQRVLRGCVTQSDLPPFLH